MTNAAKDAVENTINFTVVLDPDGRRSENIKSWGRG